MNTDIRLSITFKNHRKRKKLRMLLGPDSTDYLLDLWLSVALERPTGDLYGLDEVDIAIMAGYPNDPNTFVSTLVDTGFIDVSYDGDKKHYSLHDWVDHNGWASAAADRQDKARFSQLARWFPSIHSELKRKGVNALTAEEYRYYTSAIRPYNDRITTENESLNEMNTGGNTPSPLPSPSPLPDPFKNVVEGGDPSTITLEPEEPPPEDPIFLTLTLNDKTEFPVTEGMIAEFEELYPAVDIRQQIRNMKGWCRTNDKKRKTRNGIRKFINSWLADKQNSGGGRSSPPGRTESAGRKTEGAAAFTPIHRTERGSFAGDFEDKSRNW